MHPGMQDQHRDQPFPKRTPEPKEQSHIQPQGEPRMPPRESGSKDQPPFPPRGEPGADVDKTIAFAHPTDGGFEIFAIAADGSITGTVKATGLASNADAVVYVDAIAGKTFFDLFDIFLEKKWLENRDNVLAAANAPVENHRRDLGERSGLRGQVGFRRGNVWAGGCRRGDDAFHI